MSYNDKMFHFLEPPKLPPEPQVFTDAGLYALAWAMVAGFSSTRDWGSDIVITVNGGTKQTTVTFKLPVSGDIDGVKP